jgi:hypothetical protein
MLMHLQVASWCTASSLAKPDAQIVAIGEAALRAPAVALPKNREARPLVFLALFYVDRRDVTWAD